MRSAGSALGGAAKLPNATFGHRLIRLTSWCHYGLGVTLDQLIDIPRFRPQSKPSALVAHAAARYAPGVRTVSNPGLPAIAFYLLTAALPLVAQPADLSPFRPLDIPAALAAATREERPVLIFFDAKWSLPSRYFASATLNDRRVASLLRERFVAVRIDVGARPEAAARYRIDRTPTLLLLNAGGDERDCLEGARVADELVTELEAALAGQDAEARARAALENSAGRDPRLRERLATALVRKGCYDDALREYLWCFDEGLKRSVFFSATQREQLLTNLVRLAERHPPALAALHERRDAAEQALLAGRDDAHTARNLAALAVQLREEARLLGVFDRLPKDSKARKILVETVFDALVDAGRWAELADLLDPLASFQYRLTVARTGGGCACCAIHAPRGPGTLGLLAARAARSAAALAACARPDDARRVLDELLKFDDSPDTRRTLIEHLTRLNRPVLAEHAKAHGAASRPGREPG